VGLALTLLLVAVGVVLQFSMMAPPAQGDHRASMSLSIVRGDGAREPETPAQGPDSGRQAAGDLRAPYRAMTAGWSGSGTRAPQPGWTARQVNTRAAGEVETPVPRHVVEDETAPSPRETRTEQEPDRREKLFSVIPAANEAALVAVAPAAPSAPAVQDAPPPAGDPELPAAPRPPRARPADEETQETPEPLEGGAQLSLLGPASGRLDDALTYAVVVEGARGVAHAPVRLSFDPAVLAFLDAAEGDFLSSDGSGTRFMASEAGSPGLVDIALSRLGSAGVTGSGTLCTVTFRVVGDGMSSIALSGSRLLDASSRPLGFRRNDSHVAVD
jgi:hypothetical protein